jgi:DNA-binding transcriptional ArsR family regulator
MRPLVHPSVAGLTVEAILHALSDPVRVAIFSTIVGSDCSKSCSSLLTAGDRTIPKSSLSQHLKVLREAGLIRGERRGVEVLNTSRCAEIEKRFPGLIPAIVSAHRIQSKEKAGNLRPAGKSTPGSASTPSRRARSARRS